LGPWPSLRELFSHQKILDTTATEEDLRKSADKNLVTIPLRIAGCFDA
jgi:hypothetical protein